MQKEQIQTILVNVIIIAVTVGIFAFGYFFFVNNSSTDQSTSSDVTAQSIALIGEEITSTVSVLQDLEKSVKSSASFFRLPAFETLEDFSVDVVSEGVGRENPFVPTTWKINNEKMLNAALGNLNTDVVPDQTSSRSTVSTPTSAKQSVAPSTPVTPGSLLTDFTPAQP